jgi:hypothetical protein
MRQERLPLPAVGYGPQGRCLTWKLPVYNTVHHILTNPIYAGAYAFGRTGSRITIEGGRKRVVRGFRKERGSWDVLILDHHEGYIGWAEFERNQRLISDNANGKSFMSWGSVRRGEALLAGLLRLHVTYSGTNGSVGITAVAAISTTAARRASRSAACGSIAPSVPKLIERVQPLGIEAAIGAMEARHCEAAEKRRQVELALEQARYEAAQARRQYDAVDPDNRLIMLRIRPATSATSASRPG